MLRIIPPMSEGDLEKVLKHLPEPTNVEVALYGDFDYASLHAQAGQVVEGVQFYHPQGLPATLKDPTKEQILGIYQTSNLILEDGERLGSPRLDLRKAEWIDGKVKIELTPTEVSVSYPLQGMEPGYISAMREELAPTDVRLKIQIGKW